MIQAIITLIAFAVFAVSAVGVSRTRAMSRWYRFWDSLCGVAAITMIVIALIRTWEVLWS